MPFESLKDWSKEFSRLQDQKFSKSGNVEARVLEALCADAGEHWAAVKNGTLQFTYTEDCNVPFNFIHDRKNKLAGRLSSIAPEFKAQPNSTDPADIDQAKVVDKLTEALDEKVDQPEITRQIVEWMLLGGVAIEHTRWVPDATIEPAPVRLAEREDLLEIFEGASPEELVWKDLTDGTEIPDSAREFMIEQGRPPESFEVLEQPRSVGDVTSEVYGPLNFFVDASVKDLNNLAPNQVCMIATCRTREWIEESFEDADTSALDPDENIKIVKTDLSRIGSSLSGTNLRELLPAVQGSKGDKDPDMFVVVEAFTDRTQEYPDGRYTVFVPNQLMLRDGDPPDGEPVPLTAYHYGAVTTTFWTKGWVTDMIAPQKAFDRHISDLLDYGKKFGKSPWLLGGTLTEEDFQGEGVDMARIIPRGIGPDGNKLVAQADVASYPPFMLQSIQDIKGYLDDLAGGSDLFSESRFPGQLRGPLAVPMLQEILDTQWGPVFTHLGTRMAATKQLRINLVKERYPPVRTLHYTSRDDRQEVFKFHTSEVLRRGTEYNITIERGSLVPELRAMREARVRERLEGPLQILYLDERTGAFDKSKIAADLQMGDTARESREAKARKLAQDIIAILREGRPPPQPRMWFDVNPMLDEFEEAMHDMDVLNASEPVQIGFDQYYNALLQMAQQRAAQEQQALAAAQDESMRAQALQDVLARTSAELVDAGKDEMRAAVQGFVQQFSQNPEFLQALFTAGAGTVGAEQ